ncbi:hypothetical protein AB1L88_06310 [Tautonia sp. JC769]|uniref:hypothetical protein n=1 Tax=Tautonia sp. JC769 TaxID=3232135 RepID=UPI0034594EF8
MPPQLVLASGGGWGAAPKMENGQPVPGEFVVPNGVPVGSVAYFQVGNPNPSYVITTVTWDGGTDIKGYMSGTPTSAPAKKQEVLTGVAKNQTSYTFVVKAEAKNYTVRADVQYANGAKGWVTVEFASVRPTTTLAVPEDKVGFQATGDTNTHNVAGLVQAIFFQATATTHQHGGSFIFMQLVKSARVESAYFENNKLVKEYIENDRSIPNGEDFDGKLHDDFLNRLAYLHIYDGNIMYGWHLMPGRSMPVPAAPPGGTPDPPMMFDDPKSQVPLDWIGNAFTSSFSTYLMYKPQSGVWVALNQIDWSVSQAATRTGPGGTWEALTLPAPTQVSQPSTPNGMAAFPTWVNFTSNFINDQLNPWRPLD